MEDLLSDQLVTEPKKSTLFSKISFSVSILGTVFLTLALISISPTRRDHQSIMIARFLVKATQLCVLTGLFSAVISLVKKEKLKYLKIIGAVLNFLLFSFLVFSVVFAKIMDLKRAS